MLAMSFMILVMTAGGTLAALDPKDPGTIPLASVPEGVSFHAVGRREVVLVRQGEKVTGFLRASPRVPGTMVSWCASDDVFLVPGYGETFDRKGRLIRDHAPRDMDSLQVSVRGNRVLVAPEQVTKGKSEVEYLHGILDWRALEEWRSSHPGRELPVDFCDAPLP